MTDYLDNDNKINLLFKRFQGVVQTTAETQSDNGRTFTQEFRKSLTNIYQDDIFSENVPQFLTHTLSDLHFGGSITPYVPDSSWNNNVGDQTIGYIDLSAASFGSDLPLRFYKNVYLEPVQGTSQSWWLRDPSGSGSNSTTNNLLRDMIPFLYNDINANTYTPIVSRWDGSNWTPMTQGTYTGSNWSIDYASGILQFYQETSILNGLNIDHNGATTNEKTRPRISFIKYVGTKGAAGSNGGSGGTAGQFKVGDASWNDVSNVWDVSFRDVSNIVFDVQGFDISYVTDISNTYTSAVITNLGGIGVADISYYFFDQPNALYDGSGVLDTASFPPTIKLSWKNPPQSKSALPFGSAPQYPDGQSSLSTIPIRYLPFFQELKLDAREWDVGTSTGGPWFDLSINKTGQTILPHTLNQAWLTYDTGSTSTDLCGNAPNPTLAPYYRFAADQLEIGKYYQFRVYLINEGEEVCKDPWTGGDVSYNYLYIPEVSTNYLELGTFGPADAPTSIQFINIEFEKFDISGGGAPVADLCLNTLFPIPTSLTLRVRYGFDLSGELDPSSVQMPQYHNPNFPADVSYIVPYPTGVPGTDQQYFTLTETDILNDISWAPQHTYTIRNFYMANNSEDFSNVEAPFAGGDVSFTTGIPTRTNVGAATSLMQNTTLTATPAGGFTTANAYPYGSGTIINNIRFLDPTQTMNFTIDSASFPSTFANNWHASYLGIDSSGVELCYLQSNIVASNAPPNTYDISTNKSVGYLDVSNISHNSGILILDASATEGNILTSSYNGSGYHTDLDIKNIQIVDVCLNSFPDVCNNSYNPYEYRLRQFYRDNTGSFITNGNEATYQFYIGEKPDVSINYTETLYSNPSASLTNYMMGIPRPNETTTITNIVYNYDLSDIDHEWRSNTTLATTKLFYRKDDITPDKILDTETILWDTPGKKSHTSSLEINPNLWTSSSNYQYSREHSAGFQFQIETDYNNNVLVTPSTINVIRDVSFGGKEMWWDYTWENSAGVGTNASNNPNGFFTPSSSTMIAAVGNSTWSANTSYDHTISIVDRQLMWANGAFIGRGFSSTSTLYPYINYTNYYNPLSGLLDYSSFGNLTSGQNISINYTGGNAILDWWSAGIITSGTTITANRTIKFVTINLDVTDSDFIGTGSFRGFKVIVKDNSTTLTKDSDPSNSPSDGYWVFHNENGPSGQAGPYDGQKIKGTTSSSGGSTNGSWNRGNTLYHIFDPPLASTTTLQISIGLPNDLDKKISSIEVTLHKY